MYTEGKKHAFFWLVCIRKTTFREHFLEPYFTYFRKTIRYNVGVSKKRRPTKALKKVRNYENTLASYQLHSFMHREVRLKKEKLSKYIKIYLQIPRIVL